jgi:Alpha/beta hydrolase of unknown function (DUF900)
VVFVLLPTVIPSKQKTASSSTVSKYLPLVSTRASFNNNTGDLLTNHSETDYTAYHGSGLKDGKCPAEIAIIIHGWAINQNMATERFVRAKISLNNNSYNMPVIGFSWDSNTRIQPDHAGWTIANLIAKENGLKLAQFILGFMHRCTNSTSHSKVRIVARSLGSRVALSALDSLHNNREWKNKNFKITSVHLLGAAVDDEEVANDHLYIFNNASIVNNILEWYDVYGIKSAYGKAIENEVLKVYNLFNPKDKVFSNIYSSVEHDNALGLKGAQTGITNASNYSQANVQNEIAGRCDADGDGKPDLRITDCKIIDRGDNHGGYFGFRDPSTKKLIDDRVMAVVVHDWQRTFK